MERLLTSGFAVICARGGDEVTDETHNVTRIGARTPSQMERDGQRWKRAPTSRNVANTVAHPSCFAPSIQYQPAGPPQSAAGTLPPSQRHSQHPQQSGAQGPVESNHAEPQTSGNP